MSSDLYTSLRQLSENIEAARRGDSVAQREVGRAFANGVIIKHDDYMASFWLNLSEESRFYRTTHRSVKSASRPLNFIAVEDDYARQVRITPLYKIEEAAKKAKEEARQRAELERKKAEEEARLKAKKRAEEEARKKLTFIVTIVSVDDSLLAMLVARKQLGWDSAKFRKNTAYLPYTVKVTGDQQQAQSLWESLNDNGMTAIITAKNGLGEKVPYKAGLTNVKPNVDCFANIKKILDNPAAKGKIGIFNVNGEQIIPHLFSDIEVYSEEGLINVKVGDKWSYYDFDGNSAVDGLTFSHSHECQEGLIGVSYKSNRIVYYSKAGKEEIIIRGKYDDFENFAEGMAKVKLNGKYGYIDKTGKEIVPCKYEKAFNFTEGMAMVKLDGKYGYIDKTGKVVVPCKYEFAFHFSEGFAYVKDGNRYGYIDKAGNEIVSCKYEEARSFKNGMAMVIQGGKFGYINSSGKEVVSCIYDSAGSFSEELAGIKHDNKYGFIDKKGNVIIPLKYDSVGDFTEGLAWFEFEDKSGFIDKKGNEVISNKYDITFGFDEGLAKVKLKGRWGLIDRLGREIIPCSLKSIEIISSTIIAVKYEA